MIFNREEKWNEFFLKKFTLILTLLLYFLPLFVPRAIFKFMYGIELLQICGIAGLLLWIFFNQKSILTGVLEFKPVAYTGKISYGLYVYHSFFIRTGPGKLFIQQYPLNIFLTVGAAILSYELIEKRVLKLKNKFTPVNFIP
jgi:peptidoglycan/LPS O-acetylase OafA/YrhL